MEIKEAQTQEEFAECIKYLKSKGIDNTNSIVLYFATGTDGNIIGVIGCEYVPIIEPIAADSGNVADKLYTTAIKAIKEKKALVNLSRIEVYCYKDSTFAKVKRLYEKIGFKYLNKTHRFIKRLS